MSRTGRAKSGRRLLAESRPRDTHTPTGSHAVRGRSTPHVKSAKLVPSLTLRHSLCVPAVRTPRRGTPFPRCGPHRGGRSAAQDRNGLRPCSGSAARRSSLASLARSRRGSRPARASPRRASALPSLGPSAARSPAENGPAVAGGRFLPASLASRGVPRREVPGRRPLPAVGRWLAPARLPRLARRPSLAGGRLPDGGRGGVLPPLSGACGPPLRGPVLAVALPLGGWPPLGATQTDTARPDPERAPPIRFRAGLACA